MTSYCSRIRNCFQNQWEHQLLISNTSFLILIKVVEEYLQVFLSRILKFGRLVHIKSDWLDVVIA